MPLAAITPEQPVFRIGRQPDPWGWPDWRLAGPRGTFGNRWDDPQGQYRVLYACSTRLGAFLETLARFRAAPELVRDLAGIRGEADAILPGVVPATWCRNRMVSRAVLAGEFADVGRHGSLAYLHSVMGQELVAAGVAELDAAAIRQRVQPGLTKAISRRVYELSTPAGQAKFAGIAYESRLGDDMTNWAIFEPTPPTVEMPFTVLERELIGADDPDIRHACELLGLQVAEES